LYRLVQLADLVEKQGSLIGGLHIALGVGIGA
jgi:hypothetical protein